VAVSPHVISTVGRFAVVMSVLAVITHAGPLDKKRVHSTIAVQSLVFLNYVQEMTMKKTGFLIMLTVTITLMASCQDRSQSAAEPSPTAIRTPSVSPTAAAPAKVNNITDQWLGQWNGPEGTYLLLSKRDEQYVVKIQSLDGPATYEGVAAGDRIEFKRDGKTESIRAGSGRETGMKWLLEKKDCLIIKEGEGFCRE